MKKIIILLIVLISFSSCKSSKRAKSRSSRTTKIITKKSTKKSSKSSTTDTTPKSANTSSSNTTNTYSNTTADAVVKEAEKFKGVRYKYGGTTKKGMDCSGLVVTAFGSENISLPRTTGDLSSSGDWIDLKTVEKGDLLFFATRKNSRQINHIGIVTTSRDGYVDFIHASSSKGVMISNLAERYWYFAFVQARRVL